MDKRITNAAHSREGEMLLQLRGELDHTGADPSFFFDVLTEIIRERIWESMGLPSFHAFVVGKFPDGIGTTPEQLQTLLRLQHRHEARHGDTRERMAWLRREVTDLLTPELAGVGRPRTVDDPENVDNINIPPEAKGGTDPTYTLQRLKRDAPTLAEEVLAGNLSANAAAIAAGFRTKTISVPLDVERAARTLRRHFSADEIDDLISALQDDGAR